MSTFDDGTFDGGLPEADLSPGPAPTGLARMPHFDLPFRFTAAAGVAQVEQDSLDDVSNCVEAILRTQQGQRLEIPDFGIPDLTFELAPIKEADLLALVLRYEPRGSVVISQLLDQVDAMHAILNVRVSKSGGVSS